MLLLLGDVGERVEAVGERVGRFKERWFEIIGNRL
jgi:hypothetical protein